MNCNVRPMAPLVRTIRSAAYPVATGQHNPPRPARFRSSAGSAPRCHGPNPATIIAPLVAIPNPAANIARPISLSFHPPDEELPEAQEAEPSTEKEVQCRKHRHDRATDSEGFRVPTLHDRRNPP